MERGIKCKGAQGNFRAMRKKYFETGSHCNQAGLKLSILLPPPPESWDYTYKYDIFLIMVAIPQTRGVVQLVECHPNKHKALSSIPSTDF
jgi:hypothetical protein